MSERLERLADTIRSKSAYEKNQEYTTLLGPLFRGMETEWDRLEALLHWGQTLKDCLNSESGAKNFLEKFDENKEIFLRSFKKLKELWSLFKRDIQYLKVSIKPNDTLDQIQIVVADRSRDMEKIQNLTTNPTNTNLDISSIESSATAGIVLKELLTAIEEDKRFEGYFGQWYHGLGTDTEALGLMADWGKMFHVMGLIPMI